jgi:SHS2 domain-containing protein
MMARGTALRPGHRFLEHTGEVELQVRAESLADLMAEAGRALATLQLQGRAGGALGVWREVELRATDRVALLVDWLNELIYRAETAREVATEFNVHEAVETVVRAGIRGVRVDQPPALVKAATLHRARVEPVAGGMEADVILDV